MALTNSFQTQIYFYFEATIGAVPADAAAWEAEEGVDAFRMFCETFSTEVILGDAAVPNADMQTRVGEHQRPHKGLPRVEGGSIVSRLWGNSASFVTGDPVTATPLGRLLGHALGGTSLGNHATVTVVTSQTVLEFDDVADLVIGQVIGFVDTDDPGRSFPARITAITGVEVTIDRLMPFTVAVGDLVHGAETAYFDQAGISTSTISMLRAVRDEAWVAGGAHLALDSIAVEHGQQPKLNWSFIAARGYPPGTTGNPEVPTFTDPIEGLSTDVQAIGRDTHARLVSYGSTAVGEYTLYSAAINVGVPVLPVDTVTEESAGSPGLGEYRTEPAETTITLTVKMADGEQTKWTAGTYLAVSYYQVAPVGFGWCVDGVRGFLMGPPTPMVEDVNKYELVIQLSDDASKAGDGELAAAKIVIARY